MYKANPSKSQTILLLNQDDNEITHLSYENVKNTNIKIDYDIYL